jgi:hypothetical protein
MEHEDEELVLEADRTLTEYLRQGQTLENDQRDETLGSLVLPPAENMMLTASSLDHLRGTSESPRVTALAAAAAAVTSSIEPRLAAAVPQFMTKPLRSRVNTLQQILEQRKAEIRALRKEMRSAPHLSAEVAALAGENAALARRAREGAMRVATLRTEGASLAWTANADKVRAESFQRERGSLLEALGKLERAEEKARKAREASERELCVEQIRLRDVSVAHGAELEGLKHQVSCSKSQKAEADRTRAELEKRCAEMKTSAGSLPPQGYSSKASVTDASNSSKTLAELTQARQRSAELHYEHAAFASRLSVSRLRAPETNSKALAIAKELVDASLATSWLRTQVASTSEASLNDELSRLITYNKQLSKRLGDAKQHVPTIAPSGCQNTPAIPLSFDGTTGGTSENGNAATFENQALRASWQIEVKKQREVRRKVDEFRKLERAALQQLVQLGEAIRPWRETMLRVHMLNEGDGEGSRIGINTSETSAATASLPALPTTALLACVGSSGGSTPHSSDSSPEAIAKAMCACVEALAVSFSNRLAVCTAASPTADFRARRENRRGGLRSARGGDERVFV